MDQLLQINQVCNLFQISRSTIYRAVRRGEIKIHKIGKASRVRESELANWLNSFPIKGGI